MERIDKVKESKIRISPCHSNRASELSHPCTRRLVWLRSRWKEQSLYDLGLQYIFDEGQNQEAALVRDLEAAGFKIVRQQIALDWPEHKITGHPDLALDLDQKDLDEIAARFEPGTDPTNPVPIEAKSMAPWLWDTIDGFKSVAYHPKWWIRKYPGQLLTYMLMENKPVGAFLFKNKSTGRPKEVWVSLFEHLDYAEKLIRHADLVNEYVENGETPPLDPAVDLETCSGCSFWHLRECLRGKDTGEGAELIDDEQLEGQLKRFLELKEASAEFNRLNKAINKRFYGKTALVGDIYVTGKWIPKKTGQCTAGADCPNYEETVNPQGRWHKEIALLE